MAPRLNGSNQFSACSISQMQPTVNNASCLSAYIPPDVGLEISTPTPPATVGTSLVASFIVHATGDDASQDVSVTATVPAGLTIQSVTANGTTCTSGAGAASCSFGTLAAGDSRQVDMTLMPIDVGTLVVNLSLESTNDAESSNNSGTISVASTGTPVTPPPSTPPSNGGGGATSTASGGGGGGGSLDATTLLAMVGVLLFAIRRRGRAI